MKVPKPLCGVLLLITGLVCYSVLAQQAESTEREQIESITQEIQGQQAIRAEKTRQRELLRTEITNLKSEIKNLNVDRDRLEKDLESAIEELAENLNTTNLNIGQREESARKLVWSTIAQQELEQRSPFATLILQSDALKVDRMYNYHKIFMQHFDQEIGDVNQLVDELAVRRQEILKARSQVELARQVLQENTAALDSRATRLSQIEAQLAEEVQVLDVNINQLIEQQRALQRLIAERTSRSNRTEIAPTPASRDDISNWPVLGDVIQQFGIWRADGRIQTEGIIIGAEQHKPVYAVANGNVVFSQWLEGYKNTIIIDHGEELISVYAYCDRLLKEVNEPVEAGESIATVGVADQLGSSGLYFEIRVRNQAKNPLEWLGEQ